MQIFPSAITSQHMVSARMSANLVLVRMSLNGVNLWEVDRVDIPLIAGQTTYDLPDNTIQVLDVYRHLNQQDIDIVMGPLSRTDYASIVTKNEPGVPISYWFNRQSPTP